MRKGDRGMGLFLAFGLVGRQQTAPKTASTPLARPQTVAAGKPLPYPSNPGCGGRSPPEK